MYIMYNGEIMNIIEQNVNVLLKGKSEVTLQTLMRDFL